MDRTSLSARNVSSAAVPDVEVLKIVKRVEVTLAHSLANSLNVETTKGGDLRRSITRLKKKISFRQTREN